MMLDSETDIETRLSSLETRVSLLSECLDRLSRQVFLAGGTADLHGTPAPRVVPDAIEAAPGERRTRVPSFDRFIRGDLFARLATVCFLLVVALVLRIVTENGVVRSDIGAAFGVFYCSVLIFWSLLPTARRHATGLTIGVCGLILLCFIVFETFRYLQGLSLATCLWILLAGMLASVLVGWRYKKPSVGWIGLISAPIVFAALTFPNLLYVRTGVFFLIAVAVVFPGHAALGLWPARTGLAFLLFLFLFSWNTGLNAIGWKRPPESYEGSSSFLLAALGFGLIFLIPSLSAAARRRRLSVFERITPSAVVALAYFFVGSELRRRGIEGSPHAEVGLALSGVLLALGVWFGFRDRAGHSGLRTFLCAGVFLLVIASPSVLHSIERLAVLWAVCAFALFVLAAFFRSRSADLRFMSYLLHMLVFLVAMFSGAMLSSGLERSAPIFLALFLVASTFIHYLGSRRVMSAMRRDVRGEVRWTDRSAVALFLCSIVSLFLFGRNALMAAGAPGDLLLCAQSVWLTLLATALLLVGTRRRDREIMIIGLLVFCAAALKVFLVDLLEGTGSYLVVSVFTFGSLAAISSYSMRAERRRRA